MAYNDSPDNEFDQEMERILQEHFKAEDSSLRAPGDPWDWLESRLEEPSVPPFFSRLLGFMNPMRQGRLAPAFAVAGLAVVALAVFAVVWAISGNGGTESGGELAAVPVTEEREAPAMAAAPTATEAPRPAATQERSRAIAYQATEAPAQADRSVGVATPVPTAMAAAAPAPTARIAAAPTPMAAPTRTPAPTPMEESVEEAEPAAAPAPSPRPTPVIASLAPPQSFGTPAPAQPLAQPASPAQGTQGPRGPRVPRVPIVPPVTIPPGEQPPGATFHDYQRQPFVSALEDNVSTFSLDTDRASYFLALNWARNGYEVDPASVRAEEWINAFDYGYPPPSDNRDFAISSGLFPHPLGDDKLLARISFQAPELVDDRPLNVTLVLDASGSMAEGGRVDIARQAAESIRQSLRPEDRIAVVHFTEKVIPHYTVEHRYPDHRAVLDSINSLQPHGSTNVQAGLNLGVMLADEIRQSRPDAYNYVILMSDGVANVDATDPFAILETAYDANTRNPLRLITVGVGINNYSDPLLEQLAQHGNGWYRYLNNVDQAKATFSRDNWLALSTPFADQTRAQVTWDVGVVSRWRIIGYENRVTPDHTFTQDRREFAEIHSGAATTVFYELELREDLLSYPVSPFEKVELRWVDPATGDSRSLPGEHPMALAAWPGSGAFEGQPLAHLGAIVALSADLYGILPNAPEGSSAMVHSGLNDLLEQLRDLGRHLGGLDAYQDFLFLLEHITGDVERHLPPSNGSGYSR